MNSKLFNQKFICSYCGKEHILIDLMYKGNRCVECFIKMHSQNGYPSIKPQIDNSDRDLHKKSSLLPITTNNQKVKGGVKRRCRK